MREITKYEAIREMKEAGVWGNAVALFDAAATREADYQIYEYVNLHEKERSHGYRKRVCAQFIGNQTLTGGGILTLMKRGLSMLCGKWKKRSLFNDIRWYFVFFLLGCLVGCRSATQPQETICGVPVKGTAWELTAAVADRGDGSFIPECVSLQSATKTYVDGWVLIDADQQYRATMIIETDSTRQATHACIYYPQQSDN